MPDELDTLFMQARLRTPQDDAAAERAVRAWRATRQKRTLARLTPLALALTAAVAGVLLTQRPTELPTSAAYDVYQQATGADW